MEITGCRIYRWKILENINEYEAHIGKLRISHALGASDSSISSVRSKLSIWVFWGLRPAVDIKS